MKKQDFLVIAIIITIALAFVFNNHLLLAYLDFNKNHGLTTSFLKFGVLATFGEMLALRIKNGNYLNQTFGLFSKFIVWGLLGITIKAAFVIFTAGTIHFIQYLGFNNATHVFSTSLSLNKVIIAFAISVTINCIYAPVMMVFHKITDLHIEKHNGKFSSLLSPINFSEMFEQINWKIMWGFVFKKTIPLFWIPMHTITFMLPQEHQVLFAALLSIMLGLILSTATLKSQN